MRFRYLNFLVVALALSGSCISAAQEATPTVKHTTAAATSPASGKEMFMSYCASCHGKDAKGDGPAAGALKQAPADLSMLAKQNGGKYPSDKVTSILRGQSKLVAHGDQDMPVWGPVFWKMSQGHEEQVQMRISNLNRYLESIQEK
jgi:mono/diheme cytochrome c family protein